MNDELLFQTIEKTIKSIDDDLKKVNDTGIFFAPELYIGLCLGKDIYLNRGKIFGEENLEWKREQKLKEYGIADIIFEGESKYIIELKLRATSNSYESDIKRLIDFSDGSNLEKFFCVLIDIIDLKPDGRENYLDKRADVKKIGCHSFPTWNEKYKNGERNYEINCLLALYKVIKKPSAQL